MAPVPKDRARKELLLTDTENKLCSGNTSLVILRQGDTKEKPIERPGNITFNGQESTI